MAYKIKIQSETDMNIAKKIGVSSENKSRKYFRKHYLDEQEAIIAAAKENKIVAYV